MLRKRAFDNDIQRSFWHQFRVTVFDLSMIDGSVYPMVAPKGQACSRFRWAIFCQIGPSPACMIWFQIRSKGTDLKERGGGRHPCKAAVTESAGREWTATGKSMWRCLWRECIEPCNARDRTPMTRHLITSAIPYINGIKHLGNLIGSQLPADLYARYLRARGHEVMFLCATDEHGTPAELAAAKAGKPVAEYCAEMHAVQARIADGFRLSFDHFGRSSSAENQALTQHFAGQLEASGLIREVSEQQVYSNADGRFLPDRYIEGTCPNCGYEKARGDQCENCTKQLEPTDLINPRSAVSGSTDLEMRETKHLYLRQSAMRDELDQWIDSKTDWPVLTTSIAKKWLHDGDGLQDRGITRDLDWGVPVKKGDADWPGMEGKVFYVWFDARLRNG